MYSLIYRVTTVSPVNLYMYEYGLVSLQRHTAVVEYVACTCRIKHTTPLVNPSIYKYDHDLAAYSPERTRCLCLSNRMQPLPPRKLTKATHGYYYFLILGHEVNVWLLSLPQHSQSHLTD